MTKTNYVKLPNGLVTRIDDKGFITVPVEIDFADCIKHSSSWANARLSQLATGSVLLQDQSYKVVGHDGNYVKVLVTGRVGPIGATFVEADELPLAEYEVAVTRVSYGSRTIRLSARSATDAFDIADDDAGNHLYSEVQSEYVIDVTPVTA